MNALMAAHQDMSLKTIVTLLALVFSTGAGAGELIVEGQVLEVDPIVEHHTEHVESGNCSPAHPGAGASLRAVLAWDLRPDCHLRERVEEVVTGYRVHYRWDDRRWETVTHEPPGDTIALRVTIN